MSAAIEARRRVGLLALLACASCALGPNWKRPAPPEDTRFTEAPTQRTAGSATTGAQRFEDSNRLAADWWRLLRSPKLDALVAEAYANNPTLQQAQATLKKSQNALRAGYGIFSPQADAGLSASRQQYTPQRIGSTAPTSVFNLFALSVTVSYALDLWGGQRRTVESLRAQADAQRYQVLGTYLTLSGNVVNTVIGAAGYRAQIDTTRELIALEEEQVRLAETQAEAGTISYVNVLTLKSQVALARATLPPLEQKIDQAQHLLATLAGHTPAAFPSSTIRLDDLSLPSDIPLSLPSQLVRQRPDILVAEAQLHSSTALIGVATAALLPNVTLGASVGTNSSAVADLFSPASLFWNLVGGLVQPIFHGGTLWYQRKQAIDARDAALAGYRQTVLSALAQVADALSGLAHDAELVSAQRAALEASETAYKLVQINYQSGLADYLAVLIANAQYLQARIGFVEAKTQRLQDTVALFVALGGGWWNATPISASR